MQRIKSVVFSLLMVFVFAFAFSSTVLADDIDDTGGTDGGGSGTNIYTFYYNYDSSKDAIIDANDPSAPSDAKFLSIKYLLLLILLLI